MAIVWLVSAILLLCSTSISLSSETQTTIFIKPNVSTVCSSPCYTLEQLHQLQIKGDFITAPNTILQFLKGEHVVESKKIGHLIIRDTDNIALLSGGGRIVCRAPLFGLAFVNITKLTISGLEIVNCGAEISTDLATDALTVQTASLLQMTRGLKAAILAVNIRSLIMTAVTIKNSSGYGLLGVNLIENSQIQSSLFEENNVVSNTDHCWLLRFPNETKCQGGNAMVVYADLPEHSNTSVPCLYNLTISETTFSRGVDLVGGIPDQAYISYGSGLGVIMSQQRYGVKVRVYKSVFYGNSAKHGANINFRVHNTAVRSSVTIEECQSSHGNSIFLPSSYEILRKAVISEVGFYFAYGDINNLGRLSAGYQHSRQEVLRIEKSTFEQNYGWLGVGLALQFDIGLQPGDENTIYLATISNSIIANNKGETNTAMSVFDLSSPSTHDRIEVILKDSQFINNRGALNLTIPEQYNQNYLRALFGRWNTVGLIHVSNMTIDNCTFAGNIQTPLYAENSYTYFKGQNIFTNNYAIFGGALYLTRNSIAFLTPNTRVTFRNNIALYKGGAIYVEEDIEVFKLQCPIVVFDPLLLNVTQLDIEMRFINNSALQAGDALYGGLIDRCFTRTPSRFLYYNSRWNGSRMFNSVTNFTGQPESNSLISSDSVSVCFCVNATHHNCSLKEHEVLKYPGESFKVFAISLGQRDGSVPSVITTISYNTGERYLHNTGRQCTNLTYRINSTATTDYLYMITNFIGQHGAFPHIKINLLPCPIGFDIDNHTQVCDCANTLQDRHMTECDINTGVITRLPPYWLTNYSQHLVLHDHCPYDYCKTTPVEITMEESDINKQCAFNRTGTLCGECEDGLSMVFGTSRCLYCSNYYLALLVPFAAAGIVLVVLIFLLNLTVSVGAINGLIFYANVVKINEAVFFPPGDNSPLKVFISWVNLDLGIETCFYDGMDSYAKTWLQFAFPLYIWSILIFIIVASKHSTRLTKICGKNAVFVLATLFLLSFTKMLRTIITALSFTVLDYPDGRRTLWLYDGNVQYGKQKHVALLSIATLFLLALVPYTILIATVQFLRRCSGNICLKWVSRYMPIFDAYLGPYKDKYGYWTGLLLVLRVVLALVFVFNIFGDPAVNLLAITLSIFFVIVLNFYHGGVYKNSHITALEVSSMVNLGVLAAITSYTRQTGGMQKPVIYTSTSIALLTLAMILVYHIYIKMKPHFERCKIKNERYRPLGHREELEHVINFKPEENDEQDQLSVTSIEGLPEKFPSPEPILEQVEPRDQADKLNKDC